jgi:hypothetical protein
MRHIILISIWLLINAVAVQAQYNSKLALKIGVSYVFTGKNTELKSGLDFKTALTYRASDYIYVGPQLNLSKFFGADRVKYKNPTYFEVAPLLTLDLTRLINKPTGLEPQNTSILLDFSAGFNIDKNTSNRKRFDLSRINIGADFFSNKVVNGKMFLNTGFDFFLNRQQIRNAINLGLGGAIGLKK